MSEMILFLENSLTYKEKFYYFMDLLITNQSSSRLESLIFFLWFYIQIISGFFSKKINVFKPDHSKSDKILNYIETIFRFRGFFQSNKKYFEASVIIIAFYLIFHSIYIFFLVKNTNRKSIYNKFRMAENFLMKFSFYILFNIILDIYTTFLCFGREYNEYINDYKCHISEHILIFIIATITVLYHIFFTFFFQSYYRDTFYLSGNYYSQLLTNYTQYLTINNIMFSVMHSLINHLSHLFFLIINLIYSTFLFVYYYEHVIYYDNYTNNVCGAFHLIYLWTSIFCLIFYYVNISEKGIFYIFTIFIIVNLFLNMKKKFNKKLFYLTPFHKIKNQYFLLYYVKTVISIIYSDLSNILDKTLLIGIIQLHILECPVPNCITKTKEKLYIPNLNEWSDRSLPFLKDKVFLNSFIVNLMEFLTKYNSYKIEILINFSYFHLFVTGNLCQSIYLFEKIKHLKMTSMEHFAFERLKIAIDFKLKEKLKGTKEFIDNLEGLNVTYYFEYEYLKEKFINEIFNDLNLTIQFWKIYSKKENNEPIDFNYVFGITEKIKLCKNKVEKLWERLFSIYSGINEIFYLYLDYVEQVNDDNFLKRELEEISRKFENISSNFQNNLYNLMFKKETGIIIINGDKGKEGIIEKINHEFENNFKYSINELKGMNVSILMPQIFGKKHSEYMKRYIKIGEKRLIDVKDNISFIKDKNNSLKLVQLNIKLFPILNKNLYFIAMVIPQKIDDVILIDQDFIIQGLSMRLREKMQIENQNFFDEHEIPFYMICKNFIQFYKVFMKGNKKKLEVNSNINNKSDFRSSIISLSGIPHNLKKETEKKNNNKNENINNNGTIEINENIELEYEISIPKYILSFNKKKSNLTSIIPSDSKIVNSSIVSDISSHISLDEEEFLLKVQEDQENNDFTLKSEESNNVKKDSLSYLQEEFEEEDEEENEEKEENKNEKQNKIVDNSTIQRTLLNEQFLNNNLNEKNKNNKVKYKNDKNLKNKRPSAPYYTPTPTPTPTPGQEYFTSKNKTHNVRSGRIKRTHKASEESIFHEKLNLYRKLFVNENFDELEKVIVNDMKDKETIVYKFNFTFKKYIYNKNKFAFIIRCIENKNLLGFTDSEDDENNNKISLIHYQFNLVDQLKNIYEIYEKEKQEINFNINHFYKFINENKEFENLLINNKENIKKFSRVLGLIKKRANTFDDENASQTSVTSFNSDLSKINRILEIRESIIKNKKRLYTFGYIFVIAIIFFTGTVIFTFIFYINFYNIYTSLLELDEFHSSFYLIEISICEIISTIISLKSIFEIDFYTNESYDYSTFIVNKEEYFSTLKRYSDKWYLTSISLLNYLEINIHKFLSNSQELFWNDTKVGDYEYLLKGIDTEYYPLSISNSLTNAHSLIKSDFFQLNKTESQMTEEEMIEIRYLFFGIIENTYDYLLPNTFNLNNLFIHLFKKYNDSKIKSIWIILCVYILFLLICLVAYLNLLIVTNNHMGDGLEKILKISQEKINELILKIQNLQQYYKKRNEDLKKIKKTESIEAERPGNTTTKKYFFSKQSTEKNILQSQNNINSSGFNLDTKQNKKLNLQNKAYIHLGIIFIFGIILCLIMLLISKKVINSNNNILILQAGILGKFLMVTASTIYGKCEIAQCNISSNLDYSSFYDEKLIFKIYKAMEGFDEIYDFYHNYYIIDICGSAYDIKDEIYKECKKKDLPNSLNNTSDLLDYILNKVIDLVSEAGYNLNNNNSYNIKNTFGSSTFTTLEESFYSYLIPVTDRMDKAILKSMHTMIKSEKNKIIIIIIFFNIGVLIFILYVKYGFMRTFEYLLSISKCVIKIIPSSMISSNQDLENWLEKLNNNK